MKRIVKAINEALNANKSLILFDDDEIDFNKASKVDNSTADRILANSIVEDCIKDNSMSIELYEQIVRDAYYQVEDKKQLYNLCKLTIKCAGDKCDLNWIDTSQIDDMRNIFYNSNFNGDISDWNVSNVTRMSFMFRNSKFNGDISNWDVSKVWDMYGMFKNARLFNSDISRWDVRNVKDMGEMFGESRFNGDISNWDVSNVRNMACMFHHSIFNRDISNWDISGKTRFDMFDECPIKEEYKPKFNC